MTTEAGGFLAEVKGEIRGAGKTCGVGKALRKLPPELAADLQTALDDPDTYPSAAIARAITARGHQLSGGTIQHHRRGACTCDR